MALGQCARCMSVWNAWLWTDGIAYACHVLYLAILPSSLRSLFLFELVLSDATNLRLLSSSFFSFLLPMKTATAAVAACLPLTASAWAVANAGQCHARSSPILLATATDSSDADAANSKDDDDSNIVNIDNVEPRAVYGVSYIGGDPCGSKYNDDPFATAAQSDSSRPGMPDDAKERIRLLAEKMKKKQEEA